MQCQRSRLSMLQDQRSKKVKGFQTGDLVRATVTTGTKQGSYVGRVLVRASG